jgi:hypothetical protein
VQVLDYIFLDGAYPADSAIPESVLAELRKEFNYWCLLLSPLLSSSSILHSDADERAGIRLMCVCRVAT